VASGDTVAANAPLLSIVQIDQLRAVFFVTERDYARLRIGQSAALSTDAHPARTFDAALSRIAPVFRQTSRQARIELTVDNRDGHLKPGMFVRIAVLLDAADDAVMVPAAAMVRRGGRTGVFVLDPHAAQEDHATVRFVVVEVGLQDGERVQILGDGVTGRVVTLGQQLLEDGSVVRVVASAIVPAPQAPDAYGGEA
jgi:RND family efflux transporter MFP subunit